MAFTYQHPRPALTVDCAVFGADDEGLKIALIERAQEPFRGRWALPGGFVGVGESLEEAARRELEEETGLRNVSLEQVAAFGRPDRDPREHVVSVAFYALVNPAGQRLRAATDARRAAWFAVSDLPAPAFDHGEIAEAPRFPSSELPALAFDHREIIEAALRRLREKARREPIGFDLLPKRFTLAQLRRLYEAVLGRPLDQRAFRGRILRAGLLVPADDAPRRKAARRTTRRNAARGATPGNTGRGAARLYRFDRRQYERLCREGFDFEIHYPERKAG